MAGTGTTRDRVWGSVTNERDEAFMAADMETTQLPHLALRAAKKLNPKLQCWRWNEGFACFNTFEPGCWVPVGTPKWMPHCIYAVTSSKKEKPS